MSLYSEYRDVHRQPINRALHTIAIPLGFSSLFVVWKRPKLALEMVPAAFALAWLGHFTEGNQPAFLTNPVHVLIAPLWLARWPRRNESIAKEAA